MIKLGTNNIGGLYLGASKIGKAYLGSNLVYEVGGTSTIIPYVRGNSAYIDTGITPDQTTKVVVWARNFNQSTGSVWLFGSRIANQNSSFTVSTVSAASTGTIRVGYANANYDASDKFSLMSNYHKYELDGNVFKVDDTVVTTATSAAFSNQYSIYLFGMNNAGSHISAGLPIDICKVVIWKNGTLVRYMTPVESPSVGFYDSVSGTTFTNAGGGSLTYGTFDMAGYTPLQYVECQSTAYIDTGLKGSYSLPFIVKFQPSSANTGFRFLLGGRTSTTSERCDFQIGDSTTANKGYYFDYQTATNTVYNTASQTGNDLVWIKSNNTSTLYKAGTQLGTVTGATGDSFTTTYNMYIGALNNAGTASGGFRGRIYYVGMGSSGNFVPMEHNGVAGFYDTYNDVFYSSLSNNEFVSGPTI